MARNTVWPLAAVILSICGCVSQKEIDALNHFRATIPTCSDEKDCEFKWAAARRWVIANTTMKMNTYATDYMDTYNPTGSDGLSASVSKEPVDEKTYQLVVSVSCKGFYCLTSMTARRQSFNDYVNGKIALPERETRKPKLGHPAIAR
jgi:hypothetical protein